MLTFNAEERVSAEEALNDKWIIENANSDEASVGEKF
jgi:hypothetical protein